MVQWNDSISHHPRVARFDDVVEKMVDLNCSSPIDRWKFESSNTILIGFLREGQRPYVLRIWGFRNNQKQDMITEITQLIKYNKSLSKLPSSTNTNINTNNNRLHKYL